MIHGIILNLGGIDIIMLLNGIGFLTLSIVVYLDTPFFADLKKPILFVFIGFTLATIIGYFALGNGFTQPLGIISKLDESLLVLAIIYYLRA